MTVTTAPTETTRETLPPTNSPQIYYFEVHGDFSPNRPEIIMGYLSTSDPESTLDRLATDYRFNFTEPRIVILGTDRSTHYDLTELTSKEFDSPGIVFGKKPYVIRSYRSSNSR